MRNFIQSCAWQQGTLGLFYLCYCCHFLFFFLIISFFAPEHQAIVLPTFTLTLPGLMYSGIRKGSQSNRGQWSLEA